MIDSFLKRNRKTIVLDRILVNHNTPDQHLALDPDAIKIHTAQHFQTVTDSTNKNVTDPSSENFFPNWPIWKRYYDPINDIPNNAYDTLMDLPSIDEWNNIIKHLPDQKAPGLSKITNKLLKKLGPKFPLQYYMCMPN